MEPNKIQENTDKLIPENNATLHLPNNTEPKNNKALLWCLGILAILGIATTITFATLYFVNPATLTSTSTETTTSETATESNTKESSPAPATTEITKLLEEKYDFKEEERYFCIGARNLVCGINNFDMDKKIQFIIGHAPEDLYNEEIRSRHIDNPLSYIQNISYDDLNDLFHSYFGSFNDIAKESHAFEDSFLIKMEYLPESDSFDIYFKDGLGGTTTISVFNKVVEVNNNEDGIVATIISVTINNVISSTNEPNSWNKIEGKTVYEMGIPLEDVNKIQESLSAYHFNFVSENNEYKLVSIEKL